MANAETRTSSVALWELGFRPFFLFGCLAGAVALVLWLVALAGRGLLVRLDPMWHAHEMIHGFAVAIIVGFLFTASQNWTGIRGIHGSRLIICFGTWALGRVLFLAPMPSAPTIAIVDLAFLPIAGGFLASYLCREGQRHNLVFLVLLTLLWSSNLVFHLDRLGLWPGAARSALYFGVHIIIVMIVVVAGRVLPFFSERAVAGYHRRHSKVLDFVCIASALAFAAANLLDGESKASAVLALLAGLATLLRLLLWIHPTIFRLPILWILFAGYGWLVLGFLLAALASIDLIPSSTAVHAFTAGAIGTMIVGMVSRVSLGHTGRPIKASRLTVAAYGAVIAGGLLRVFGPLATPSRYSDLILLSGILWALALLAIIADYAPKLLLRRPDGRPG